MGIVVHECLERPRLVTDCEAPVKQAPKARLATATQNGSLPPYSPPPAAEKSSTPQTEASGTHLDAVDLMQLYHHLGGIPLGAPWKETCRVWGPW